MTTVQSAPGAAHAVVSRFAAVLEQPEFRDELHHLSSDEWGWGTPREVRLHPLKAHRGRCTFDVAVRTERGWHAVIAKVHTDDRSDVFRTMAAVRDAGFGPMAECSIPQPLRYLPSLHVLLEEKVPGTQATEIFLHGAPHERAAAAERCARWVTQFHAMAPHQPSGPAIADELLLSQAWRDQLASLGEPFAAQSALLFQQVEAAVPVPGASVCCAGHGSFIPEHVWLSPGRTAVIDLDECGNADPARDVAWFIVSLQRLALKHLGSLDALNESAERFSQTYAAGHGLPPNVPFYRALECLHRAWRDVYKRIPPSPQWAETMLSEGLRVVAKL